MLDLVSAMEGRIRYTVNPPGSIINQMWHTSAVCCHCQTTTANWTDSGIDMPRIAYLDFEELRNPSTVDVVVVIYALRFGVYIQLGTQR